MPSSTFSFERAPTGAVGKTFVVALLCAGLLLGLMEHFLRSAGGYPSVPLSTGLYAANLERGLATADTRTTLLLGASRIRSGFSSEAFEKHTDRAPLYYLATSGESPLALLIYLAEGTNFSGKLIVSLTAGSLTDRGLNEQQYIVEFFEKEWNWNRKLNHFLGNRIASKFVLRQENYSISNVLKSAVDDKNLPPVPYWRRHKPNGESFYDFSLIRNPSLLRPPPRQKSNGQTSGPKWEENLRRLKRAILQLRDRGAQVALVRFPTSGNWWANDQDRWPRDRYWDRIADAVGPITLHFEDVKALKDFRLPDTSHIDWRDKKAFTAVLMDALAERGMAWER